METNKIKVYIKTDDQNRITAIGSGIFIVDTTEWIEIDEGLGDKYAHAQNDYLTKGLADQNGCYNYNYINDEVIERTQAEKQADLEVRSELLKSLGQQVTDLPSALAEQCEINRALQEELVHTQLALIEIYERLEG